VKDPRIGWLVGATAAILVVVLIVLLVTREDDSPAPAATTLPPSTSTTPDTSTTSSEPPTTTTTIAATTTTEPPTTTTEAAGSWAPQPLVVANFGALGWWDGAGWVQVVADTELPVTGGEDYAVASLDVTGTTTGGPPTILCEPLENPGVVLADADALGAWPGPVGVAISAGWDLVPHVVEAQSDDGTYAAFASQLLASRGLDVAEPPITQLLRVDLEGDGTDEALVATADFADGDGLLAQPGDYSMVFLRKIVDGEVQTAILAESIVTEVADGETPFVESHGIGAVADLSGDGVMEIVVSSAYYEGVGVGVWEWAGGDLGPVYRIGSGCGA
jgi:hypothetical protein